VIGKKVYNSLNKKGVNIHNYYKGLGLKPGFIEAQKISQDAVSDFLNKKVDKVMLIFNQFISSFTQRPSIKQLLPYESPAHTTESDEKNHYIDYIFEPDSESILNDLLPKQISVQVLQTLLDNSIGEHAARMTAMDSATNNANDLISTITVQMNRARQADITTELTEIISGAEAL